MDQQAPAKLARSAERLSQSAAEQTDSADRRTELAATRTVLAAERTYAAWMRTALAALASGVGARTLLEGHVPMLLARAAGVVLVLFAAACLIAGVWREIQPGAPPPRPDVRRIPPAALLGFNGFLLLVCLAALIGVVVA